MAYSTRKIILAMLTAEILAMIEITMIFAALRYMVEDFGSPEAIGWTITGFLLASGVSAALFGRLGDMYDRKTLLLIVIALSVVGSLIAGSTSTLAGVVVGRTIQGCAGGIFPLCIGIMRQNIAPKSLPIFIGLLSGVMTVSAGMGLLLGGLIVDHLTWHWIFYTTALLGVIAFVSVYLIIPSSPIRTPEPGTNFVGGILFAPGFVCLLLAFTKIKEWGWTSHYTLGFMLTGLVLIVAWLRSELKAKVPLLNIRILFNKDIFFATSATILFGFSWMQFGQIWSLFLQQPTETGAGLGLSASFAGLITQPQTLMALIGGPLAGWLFLRIGMRASVFLSATLLAAAWVAAIFKNDSIAFIVGLMFVMGLSSAMLISLLVTAVAKAAPAHQTSEAIGIYALLRTIAASIGAVIVFSLLSVSTVPGADGRGEFPNQFSYHLSMSYVAAGCFLIGLIYIVFYKPSPRTATTEDRTNTAMGTDAA